MHKDLGEIMLNDKRIRVIIGHYGSGKTEFSVNYAMKLAELTDRPVAIADLDVVNPYFRSRERSEVMEAKGIKVIGSSISHSATMNLPAINAGVLGPLQNEEYHAILDVGGDSTGARALVRYTKYFTEGDYDMFCVVNTNRPETSTKDGIIKHVKSIESVVGAKVTGLVNNTHLLRETSREDVLEAQVIIKEVSEVLSIPIKYVSTLESVARELPKEIEGDVFPITMYMRDIWM